MGGSLEKALFDYQVSWMPTEDPTFVIPSSVKLSPAQLEILGNQNVRPGMAFSLTNEGTIVPPNAKKFKLKMIKSFVSISAESVLLTEVTRGMFSVGFTYSSTMATCCTIHFNVRDHTTSSRLDIKQALFSWGPFHLASGMNVAWSTSSLQDPCTVDYCKLPIYVHFGKPSANYYDVVISFEPVREGWAPNSTLSIVGQFNSSKVSSSGATSKKSGNSVSSTLYAKSFLFPQRHKGGLEDPTTSASRGFDVAVSNADTHTVTTAPAATAVNPEFLPDDQRFAANEFDVTESPKTAVRSTNSPSTVSAVSPVVETSNSGTIIQSVVYYFRLPYHSGGRYLDVDPNADNADVTASSKDGTKRLKKLPPGVLKEMSQQQRGVNVFPSFIKTNRAVVIPQNDPDELLHQNNAGGGGKGGDGDGVGAPAGQEERNLEKYYQPLEDHEIDGMVSRFMQDFSDDSGHDDEGDNDSKPSSSHQTKIKSTSSRGGSAGSKRGEMARDLSKRLEDSLEEPREDYSMYESPTKPHFIGGTANVTPPILKTSNESPARSVVKSESVGGRIEIRPTDLSTAVPAPLTVQSVGSSAAMSVASERSLSTGVGGPNSGRPPKGGNFSPDASGTSYDFSGGGGSDSPAMFSKTTFVNAIKKDVSSLPGGKLVKGQFPPAGASAASVTTTAEMFTSAPMVAQCVHLRFKTVGGVYNAMPMFGMEGYHGKDSAPPGKAEGSSEGPTAAPAAPPSSAIDPDDCIICLENPRDTAMFPCRHLCVCSGCASMSMSSESKCPMCRNPVTIMLQFKKRRTVNV